MANAFGLGDMASMGIPGGNPVQGAGLLETLELVRKAWSSFAIPPGLTPTLDPVEIERRVAELKSIEQWLAMNLTMLRGTIQAFEIQQSTLSTLRSIGESSAAAVTAAAAAAQTGFPPGPPDEAGVGEPEESPAAPTGRTAKRAGDGDSASGSTGDGDGDTAAASDAAESPTMPFDAFASGTDPLAWWDMLQKQFGQVANAAMASIPVPGPLPGSSASVSPITAASAAARGQSRAAGQPSDASPVQATRTGATPARKSDTGTAAGKARGKSSAAGAPAAGAPAAGSAATNGRRRSTRSG